MQTQGGHTRYQPETWKTGQPSDYGWDPELPERTDRQVMSGFPKLYSLLLIRHGTLVMERYYHGADADTLMDVRSVTKSFTGAAIGVAVKEGLIRSIEDTVGDYFPDEVFPPDGRVRSITIRELLTMSSGLYWKTGNKLGEAFINRLHRSKDWLRFIMRLPVDPERRGTFLYRSPDSHLLSCLISRVSGMKSSDFLKEKLFVPLGIWHWEWDDDPQGNTAGHVFLRMRSRDLAKLGMLYLNGGRWGEDELLPKDWVSDSMRAHLEGMETFGSYGFQWWCSSIGGIQASYALGHGGNFIIVLPELDCVMVAASEPKVSRWRDPRVLIEKVLLPACLDWPNLKNMMQMKPK
jgi:CubicO group peptidase (beta-lactamase class C family)